MSLALCTLGRIGDYEYALMLPTERSKRGFMIRWPDNTYSLYDREVLRGRKWCSDYEGRSIALDWFDIETARLELAMMGISDENVLPQQR